MSRLDAYLNNSEKEYRNIVQDNSQIYIAEVMDTRSPTRCGDIKVWVLNSQTDKFDPNSWITASYCSMMYGSISNDKELDNDTSTFGVWFPTPYVGNYVFIFFPCVIGQNSTAYWFGSPMGLSNIMIPGLPYDITKNNQEDYQSIYDKNYLKKINQSKNSSQEKKKVDYINKALEKQGLDKDKLRGISNASSFRETPSHCYGFLSPLGNQFVIDDGWSISEKNKSWLEDERKKTEKSKKALNQGKDDYGYEHNKKEWISSLKEEDKENDLNRFHAGYRFRTRNGTQILILDSGNIYMINSDGSAWIELSEDGYIDCYSQNGISASSDGDINLYSKSNINMQADGYINMHSDKGIILDTPGQCNANVGSFNSKSSIITEKITANNGLINNLTSHSAQIQGIFEGTLQGTSYYATFSGNEPMNQPTVNFEYQTIIPSNIEIEKHKVKQKVDEEEIEAYVSRKPTHEPYAGHDRNDRIPTLNTLSSTNNTENTSKIIENNVK